MKQFRPVHIAAFVLVITAYVAIRFWHLTDSCLWFDEIFSIHAAEHSWDSLLSFVALDLIHPPLFYVLLKLWIGVGGESLFWLRLFPVLFSIIAIYPFISLCRELKLPFWTHMLALFFLATNGSLIKYSQEVRMYAPLMCVSLFSTWIFARYFVKGKSFLPLVIVNVLMVYTHYFGWFVVLAEVGLIVWFQRIKWRPVVVMFGITLAAFVPWLIAVLSAAQSGSDIGENIGWVSRPGPRQIGGFVLNIVEPFYYQASTAQPVSMFLVSLPLLFLLIAAAILFSAKWGDLGEYDRRHLIFLLTFIILPVIIAFAASWLLPYSIWGTRHVIIVFAPFCIVLAMILARLPVYRLKVFVLSLIILFSGYAGVMRVVRPAPQYSWCAWGPLARAAADWQIPIYTFEDLVAYQLWFAVRDRETRPVVIRINEIEGVREDKAYFLPRGFNAVPSVDLAAVDDPRLWIAHRAKTLRESEPPLRDLLVKGYRIIDKKIVAAAGEEVGLFLMEK